MRFKKAEVIQLSSVSSEESSSLLSHNRRTQLLDYAQPEKLDQQIKDHKFGVAVLSGAFALGLIYTATKLNDGWDEVAGCALPLAVSGVALQRSAYALKAHLELRQTHKLVDQLKLSRIAQESLRASCEHDKPLLSLAYSDTDRN